MPSTGRYGLVRAFFANSTLLDHEVLRRLSHIAGGWEADWDPVAQRYVPEPNSFAADLNVVIELVASSERPGRYHDHEDLLAEQTKRDLKWPIEERGGRWFGEDYGFVLEQGAFSDWDQQSLVAAAAGRVRAALDRGQAHFDDMEERHRLMVSDLLATTIYHRHCQGTSLLTDGDIEDVD